MEQADIGSRKYSLTAVGAIDAHPIIVSSLWRRRAIRRWNDDLGAQARPASFRGGGRDCSVAKCWPSDGC
jgi:hypothetical protein